MKAHIINLAERDTSGIKLTLERLLARIAIRRGCRTAEDIRTFLSANPDIQNPLDGISETSIAISRVSKAFSLRQPILVFGDYDCDGICSTAILVELLEQLGANVTWRLPVRETDEYGLTLESATKILHDNAPKLVVTVDCGTNSAQSVELLAAGGCDTIVVDHHSINDARIAAPIAHLNPKHFASPASPAWNLSASGLAFFFAEVLAEHFGVPWNRDRAIVYAGLGTLVDVVPLTQLNRALVKRSIRLCNATDVRTTMPGLAALLGDGAQRQVSSWTYGFHLGPILNATGRIADAARAVRLLLAHNTEEAMVLAGECLALNERRKDEQADIYADAIEAAEHLLATDPDTKVIVLGSEHWHPGIIGIVASRIRERFFRPTILFGAAPHNPEVWKGSGRSIAEFDLGVAINDALRQNVILSGGGHPMAAGLSIRKSDLGGFALWINSACNLTPDAFAPRYEVLPSNGHLHIRDWAEMFATLEPFGAGNQRPGVLIESGTLTEPIRFLHRRTTDVSDNEVEIHSPFAASLSIETSETHVPIEALTYNIPRARAAAQQPNNTKFRFILSLRRDQPKRGHGLDPTRTLFRWIVDYIDPIPDSLTNTSNSDDATANH